MTQTPVSVTIVTHNSAFFLSRCLDSLLQQGLQPLEIVVADNASTDGTRQVVEPYLHRVRFVANARNIGFAAAQNQAIGMSLGDWVLTLNPDVALDRDFLERLVRAGEVDPVIGAVCGKLLSADSDFEPMSPPQIDSAGIYFTSSLRHFDRGGGTRDDGRYDEPEFVFGATAAAALYRREMIHDVSVDGAFFDPDFFVYREDADLAWRAQLLGWKCLYTPRAIGHHVRRLKPGQRRGIPAAVNMHCVKNRFLMRTANVTAGIYRRHWVSITARDLLVLGACLVYEPTSLPALWHVARCFPRALGKRRAIMRRRRVADRDLLSWFGAQTVTQPFPELSIR